MLFEEFYDYGAVSLVQVCTKRSAGTSLEPIEIPRASPPSSGCLARFFRTPQTAPPLCIFNFEFSLARWGERSRQPPLGNQSCGTPRFTRPLSTFRFFPLSPFDNAPIQWSNTNKVNLIKQLFSRHPHADQVPSSSFWNWAGQSGKEYQYEIYPLEAAFRPLPGIYIYAKQLSDGDWSPVYIAQTRDLHQRLEGHVRLEDAVAAGATHLHAHYCEAGQGARCSEEQDLIHRWQPPCNEVFQS